MKLQIFDVEHGACALLTADNGTRLMIDCGHNASSGWRPGDYLRGIGCSSLDMLGITNYDEDHASGAPNLFDRVNVQWLWRNTSVSGSMIKSLKTTDGMGNGIDRLVQEIERNFSGPASPTATPPFFEGLERFQFWCTPQQFDDENNLSMVAFLKCHGVGVMFPGDIERNGAFPELLKRTDFQQALRDTNVYVAPHHGRDNGCSVEAKAFLKNVWWCVISDKGYMYDTQQTMPYYYDIAKGAEFRGATRYVLTTRNDGSITFNFAPGSWGAS